MLGIIFYILLLFLGYEDGDGKFTVEEYLFYGGGPQKPLTNLSNHPLLVLVSGLDQVRHNLNLPIYHLF